MAARPRPQSRPPGRRGALLPTLAILGGLGVVFLLFTSFYTDFLWYRSVDKQQVFTTLLATRFGLFLVFGLLMGVSIWLTMYIAYRTRPELGAMSAEQVSLERYRASLEPFHKIILIGLPSVLGLMAGMSGSAQWEAFLQWRYASPFGAADPQFNTDIGFFVMQYPFLRFVLGFGIAVLILCLLMAVVTHYVFGGLRLQGPSPRTSRAAHVQLSILAGLFMLLKAVAYWMDRYGLAIKSEPLVQGFTGLKYRDVYAVLPAKNILVVIALVCAVLFFVNAWRQGWVLPLIGTGLLAISALVIGGIYPAIVQQFQVKPSELVREQEYIKRNIEATRSAYGLADTQFQDYSGEGAASAQTLEEDAGTLTNIRLLDPAVVAPTFRQLQQIRSFYSFPDALDIDRYPLRGGQRGAVIAVREVNLDGVGERNWANDHAVYTHGYGVVAAYDNTALPGGGPAFFASDIPVTGELEVEQPRIYFGEESPDYSIVGAPEGTEPRELDFPDDTSPSGQRNNTYTGSGGVGVGDLFHKLLFATRFQDPNIVLSDLVNAESKILFDREPAARVAKVAPWLTLDGDPYPVVVDGQVKWIVDAYTTTNAYPYSSRTSLSDATTDALTQSTNSVTSLPSERINYLRNSVKAVVDAYDGTVTLYAWQPNDPMLQTWTKAFGGVVTPMSEAPAELVAHFRYPEDMFKVQRTILSRYHVTDPASFYNGQDFWTIPIDPTNRAVNALQPPYYLTLRMPGTTEPRFSLTTTFAPQKRQTLAAFMAVDSAPGPGYGTIRVLQLPRNTTVPGPTQVQNVFESEPAISEQLTLLRRGGSEIEFGNLLSLPVSGGLLYVEPVYVRAAQGQGFPLLRKVLASYGSVSVLEDTLGEALAAVFEGSEPEGGGTDGGTEGGGGSGQTEDAQADLTRALADAQAAYEAGQTALQAGDFTAYGKAQADLKAALDRAAAAQRRLLGEDAATSAPTEGASPGASPEPNPSAPVAEPSTPVASSPVALGALAGLDVAGVRGPTAA
ncbi:MAG TPA: UPF0182 family protein [Candidatus Nanopelagicales bacterium]